MLQSRFVTFDKVEAAERAIAEVSWYWRHFFGMG
jgi:hypothetical protein